ncbi:uncharacterized protein LOC118647932 [Monomorium pharaonis]|uniref:uncharacterized protein LOC118647932 n=1 Tax=Monomorium pharaonis TaxID=307658 RepID=UPI0017479077|nr:uncharacterized protein LOC118647932 [Monomorium pharaonis]
MNVEEVVIDGEKWQKCNKCGLISRRRYNTERHYKRFHDLIIPGKTCCNITFYTKGDFNCHKQDIHGEKKKHTKDQETQNDNEISQLLHEDCCTKNAPKKHFLSKWRENIYSRNSFYQAENRLPLTNMENIGSIKRNLKKRPPKRNVNLSVSSSSTKENIQIYNITDVSEEGLDNGLKAIKF